jgi:gas vesicle protein
MKRTILIFAAGALAGGLVGGVAGYVINDLTSQENPEVVAEQQADAARQAELEAFLNGLAAPAAAEGSN